MLLGEGTPHSQSLYSRQNAGHLDVSAVVSSMDRPPIVNALPSKDIPLDGCEPTNTKTEDCKTLPIQDGQEPTSAGLLSGMRTVGSGDAALVLLYNKLHTHAKHAALSVISRNARKALQNWRLRTGRGLRN